MGRTGKCNQAFTPVLRLWAAQRLPRVNPLAPALLARTVKLVPLLHLLLPQFLRQRKVDIARDDFLARLDRSDGDDGHVARGRGGG